MSRIETRKVPVEFDREEVRAAFLNGENPSDIALRFGRFQRGAVANYIYHHRQKWLDEARFNRILSDNRRTVIPVLVENKKGLSYVMPVSVARNTMHLLARGEARHAG